MRPFLLRKPDDLPTSHPRRYFAAGSNVICQRQGVSYLVCSIDRPSDNGSSTAETLAGRLADALNQNPVLAA
ncbi:hypothetical protein [Pararhodobacter sp.]|uniref:hypothetical protein n=1 Tax=Pararhodobacter sp. TaxID=2127056 RepID=UPI002FDCB589